MSILADDLRAARKLIEHPARWCRGAMARDACGHECMSHSKTAQKWCAMGALFWRGCSRETLVALGDAARKVFPGMQVTEINDCLGRAAVLRVYDAAIAEAEGRGFEPERRRHRIDIAKCAVWLCAVILSCTMWAGIGLIISDVIGAITRGVV